jgi:alpha(1,3/1,4) fucosyltransferase
MKFGFWNFYTLFSRNRMFEPGFTPVGDELSYPAVHLGRELRALGHEAATLDMADVRSFDKVFFIDYPTRLNKYFRELLALRHPEMHLILAEPPIVRPDNYFKRNHAPFKKVLTWKRDVAASDPNKYILYHLANKLRAGAFSTVPFARRKLCVLINSFMASPDKRELYSERVRAVRWFEAYVPRDFDLMGLDWDKLLFPGPLARLNYPLRFAYRRVPGLKKLKVHRYPSFIGPNKKSKHETLKYYRFCIAYENSVEPDYVSEKLFDSFFAGCVPIYLGAPNVLDYIPAETFIDKRKFASYDDLYRYISTMSEAEYNKYLEAIAAFVNGPGVRPFTAEAYSELFIRNFAPPAATRSASTPS